MVAARSVAGLAALLLAAALPAAHAADALNGKSLYLNGPLSGGATCQSCHGPTPASNVNGILRGANQPGVIAGAFSANLGGMGSLFNGKFSAAELADLAAFIGNPNVTAAPAATLAPSGLTFSGVAIGQTSAALAATLSNSGNAALNIGSIAISGAAAGDFILAGGSCANGAVLAPAASCSVQASFRPSAAGVRAASIDISHNATGGVSSVSLSGTGNATPQATIALSASSIDFGALLTGVPSAVRTVTVSNSGQAALNFSAIGLGGANAGAFILGGTCAVAAPVAAGASCTVTVQASPQSAGVLAASLTLASNASNGNAVIGLSASAAAAAPALTANPSAVAFGLQTIGAAAVTQNVTLTNSGNVGVSLTSITVTGSNSFSAGANNCGASLAAGASCTVPVRFAPAATGSLSALLAISSSAPALQVALSGSGTTQAVAVPALSEAGPIAFANTQVGASSAIHTTTLSNSGSGALKIATLTLGGSQPGDFVLGGSCAANVTVSAGASCTLDTSFKPTAAGSRSADLMLVTDGGAQFHLALGGSGVVVAASTLTINPQSFDFGAATIGGTAGGTGPTRRFTLTNSGSAALTLASAAYTGPFAAVADSTGCAAFPLVLQPGAACDLVVRYTPVNPGASSGNVVIQAGAASVSWTIALSGQASAAGAGGAGATVPQNQGSGGCSAARNGNDPVLALLVLLALAVLVWRRRQAERNGNDNATFNHLELK